MTTNNHTDISSGAVANASTINNPLGQLDAAIGNLTTLTTTAKTSAVAAINEVDANADAAAALVGTLASLTTTAKSSAVAAINELDAQIGAAASSSGTLGTSIDTDGTLKAGAVDVASVIADTIITDDKLVADAKVGSLASLTTTAKTSAVAAINELDGLVDLLLSMVENGTLDGATFLEVDSFTQSLGAEQLTNGDMETGDPPTGWLVRNAATLTSAADERTGGSGSASLDIARSTTADPGAYRSFTAVAGSWVELSAYVKLISGTDVRASIYESARSYSVPREAYFVQATDWTRIGLLAWVNSSTSVRLTARGDSSGDHSRVDDVSVRYISLNEQRTIPANADIRLAISLPAAPYINQGLLLLFRVKATTSTELNCWAIDLYRDKTNSVWSMRLIRYIDGTATIASDASSRPMNDIGEPDQIKVKAWGSVVQVFTQEDGFEGGDWIARTPPLEISYNDTERGLQLITMSEMVVDTMSVRITTEFGYGLFGDNTFVLVGDSKTDYDQWWPTMQYQLQQRTGQAYPCGANWAVGGYTTVQAKTAIDAQIAAYAGDAPALCLISLGANNIPAPAASVATDLAYIAEAIHAAWPDCQIYFARPYVVGETAGNDTYAGYIDTVISTRTSYCHLGPDERVYLEGGDAGATYMHDDKHPNQAGYIRMGYEWADVLS